MEKLKLADFSRCVRIGTIRPFGRMRRAVDLQQVGQVLTGLGQRLTVGFAMPEQVTLEAFDDRLGDDSRLKQISLEAPACESADIDRALLDRRLAIVVDLQPAELAAAARSRGDRWHGLASCLGHGFQSSEVLHARAHRERGRLGKLESTLERVGDQPWQPDGWTPARSRCTYVFGWGRALPADPETLRAKALLLNGLR